MGSVGYNIEAGHKGEFCRKEWKLPNPWISKVRTSLRGEKRKKGVKIEESTRKAGPLNKRLRRKVLEGKLGGLAISFVLKGCSQ